MYICDICGKLTMHRYQLLPDGKGNQKMVCPHKHLLDKRKKCRGDVRYIDNDKQLIKIYDLLREVQSKFPKGGDE